MQREEALRVLGLSADDARDRAILRAAYYRRMRAVHPDLNRSADATAASASVSVAYRVLTDGARPARAAARARAAGAARAPTNGNRADHLKARVLNESTVSVEGNRREVFAAVLEASHRLGEVSHVDADAGVVGLVAEFLHAPTCSIMLTLRARSEQRVHVVCNVESLSGGDAPPVGAVTRLVTGTVGSVETSELFT